MVFITLWGCICRIRRDQTPQTDGQTDIQTDRLKDRQARQRERERERERETQKTASEHHSRGKWVMLHLCMFGTYVGQMRDCSRWLPWELGIKHALWWWWWWGGFLHAGVNLFSTSWTGSSNPPLCVCVCVCVQEWSQEGNVWCLYLVYRMCLGIVDVVHVCVDLEAAVLWA